MPQHSSSRETRKTFLDDVGKCVLQDRNASYGEPEDNFATIATLWNAQLGGRLAAPLAAHDVAVLMAHVKLARIQTSPAQRDHWIDLAGYAACGAACVSKAESQSQPGRFKVGDRVDHRLFGSGTFKGRTNIGNALVEFDGRAGQRHACSNSELTLTLASSEAKTPGFQVGDRVQTADGADGIVEAVLSDGRSVGVRIDGFRCWYPPENLRHAPPESKTA